MAGIECDGATYHSDLTIRDRDRIRQEILEGLGWKIYRVWSTDWFNDQDRESARMLAWLEGQCQRTLPPGPRPTPAGPRPRVQDTEQDGLDVSEGKEAAADEVEQGPRGRHRQLDGIDYYEVEPGWFEIWVDGRPVGEIERVAIGDSGPAQIYGGRLKITKPRFRGSFLNSEAFFETDDIYEAIRRVAREGAEPRGPSLQ